MQIKHNNQDLSREHETLGSLHMGEGGKIVYSLRKAMQRKPGTKWEILLTAKARRKEGLQGDHDGTALLQKGREKLANGWKCCIASGTCLQRKGWRNLNK